MKLGASFPQQTFVKIAAKVRYHRAIVKRFEFAKWMFEQPGFSPQEAGARGRLMVTSLIGKSTASLKAIPD